MNKKLKLILMAGVLICNTVLVGCSTTKEEKASDKVESLVISNDVEGEVVDIEYTEVPERVVSLAGFTTEMLLALGLEDKIVGYAFQDNEVLPQYKESFEKLNAIAKTGQPSVESVLELEPDFYIGWAGSETYTYDFLTQNGMTTYTPRVEYSTLTTMEEVYEDFENLGKIFKVEDKAKEIIDTMKSEIEEVEKRVKDKETKSVFIYDSGEEEAFTAANGLPSELIKSAGGKNVFEGGNKNWIRASWENVVEANPEYIIIMTYSGSENVDEKIEFLKNHEALKDIDAIKNENFLVLGLTDVTAGERNADAVKTIADFLHPEN